MKNLLIVTASDFPYGSASANLARLMGAGLVNCGWRVDVLIQRGKQRVAIEEYISGSGEEAGVKYRYCGWCRRPENKLLKMIDSLCGALVPLFGIASRKLKGRLDCVLIYNSSTIENLLIFLMCKLFRIPVLTYNGEWFEKASVVRKWYYEFKWLDFLFRMKYLNCRFDGLLMASQFLTTYYAEKRAVPADKLLTLPNFVNFELFNSPVEGASSVENGKIRIGYCGTPTRKDGAEDLLSAFKLVADHRKGVELLIIGDQPGIPGLLESLKEKARKLGVAEQVVFTGRVPFQRMPGLLHSCDILALARPSGIFAEAGFPTKLGEYMACRKPVVATRVGDLARYLTHKVNIMLSEPDRPDLFAEQIIWLIDRPQQASGIADGGYEWAMEHLEYKAVARQLDGFLIKMLSTKARRK